MTTKTDQPTEQADSSGSNACSTASRHKPIDQALTRDEQDDLFRQMRKWLAQNNGIMRQRQFFLSEVENVYRMMATILQQRKTIEAGNTAINQAEYAADRYREERDAAQHFIVETGSIPGIDCECRCDQCVSVAQGMERAGYLADYKCKWWDS